MRPHISVIRFPFIPMLMAWPKPCEGLGVKMRAGQRHSDVRHQFVQKHVVNGSTLTLVPGYTGYRRGMVEIVANSRYTPVFSIRRF